MKTLKTQVIEVGSLAYFDEYEILILFNQDAPDEVKEFSIIHQTSNKIESDYLQVGGTILFNDQEYTIKQVGSTANQSFNSLGHISIYFGLDDETELLPGAIVCQPPIRPQLNVGDWIVINV